MAETGRHLRIISMGSDALGVKLEGQPGKPEPLRFLVKFPGGEIELARIAEGDYWAHISANHEGHWSFDSSETPGRLVEAGLECLRKQAADVEIGDFGRDDIYHVALRVRVKKEGDVGPAVVSEVTQKHPVPRIVSNIPLEPRSDDKIREFARQMAESHYDEAIKEEANLARLHKIINYTGKSEEELKAEEIEILTERFLKTVRALVEAIQTKDLTTLFPPSGLLRVENPHTRRIFNVITGVDLGKTDRTAATALKSWAREEVADVRAVSTVEPIDPERIWAKHIDEFDSDLSELMKKYEQRGAIRLRIATRARHLASVFEEGKLDLLKAKNVQRDELG